MVMRPLLAASLLGISLLLSTGCGDTKTPDQTTQATPQNTPQPQATVAIENESPQPGPAEATKPDAPQPIKRPEMAKLGKDPFVNPFKPGSRPPDVSLPVPDREGSKPPALVTNNPQTAPDKTAGVEIPEPEFEVRGLVRSGTGMMALLSDKEKTRIVQTGQTVGEYRVAGIDNRGVTVTRGGQKFRVKMKNEFGL